MNVVDFIRLNKQNANNGVRTKREETGQTRLTFGHTLQAPG